MTYQQNRHDIGITNAAGTIIGMMVAQDKNGTPKWDEIDDEYLAQQYFTGDAGYGNLPTEKELALRQDDWRGGFGIEYFSADEPSRYNRSFGMDMRFKSMAILGPKPTAITKPLLANYSTVTNYSFETWGTTLLPTNWLSTANAAGGYVFRSTLSSTGSYSAGIRASITSTAVNTWRGIYQTAPRFLKGGSYMLAAGVRRSNAAIVARVQLYDGVSWSCSTGLASTGSFATLSVTKTLAENASALKMRLRHNQASTSPNNVYFDKVVLTGNFGFKNIAKIVDYNDRLYFPMGKTLTRLSTGGSSLIGILQGSTISTVTSLEPFVDNRLYIAMSTASDYHYMSTAEVATQSTAVARLFRLFRTVHSSSPTMWANDGDRTIRSNLNPINGGTAWSGQTNVGSNYYAITDLITKSGALYIMKEDMPYYLSSAGSPQNDLAPELASLIASTSGKNAYVWKNKIYIPCGTQGLLETDGLTNTFIQPSIYGNNLPEFNGRVMAVAGDDQYLFIAVDYGSYAYILAGREELADGAVSWRWHPISTLTISGVNYLHVSNVVQKRLWIAGSSTADSIYYIPLPTGYGNIVTDSNRKFTTEGYFYTPYLHGNFRDTPKAFPLLEINLGHSYSTKQYVTAYYEMQGSTKQTYIGKFVGTAANRSPQKYLRDTTAATPLHPQSRAMRLKIHAHTTTDTTTPIILGYKLKGILYPPRRKIIVTTIRVANEIASKMGLRPESHYDMVKTALDDAIAATWPVIIKDIDGNTQSVKFMPLPGNIPRVTLIKDEAGRVQERHYNVMLMVVTTNTTAGGSGDSSTAA